MVNRESVSICDQDLLRNITSFVVKEPNSLSDHRPIKTWLKVNRHLDNDSSNEAIINDSLTPLPKQFFLGKRFVTKI